MLEPTSRPPAGRPAPFVFLDPAGRRWPRIRVALVLTGTLVVAAMAWFAQSLLVTPWLQKPMSNHVLKEQLKALQRPAEISGTIPANSVPTWLKFKRLVEKTRSPVRRAIADAETRGSIAQPGTGLPEIRLAYYSDGDASSLQSLVAHADQLTHVTVDRFSVALDADAHPRLDEAADAALDGLAAAKGLVVMPVLSNAGEDGSRLAEPVEFLANGTPEMRSEFVAHLVERLAATKAGGVLVDFEGMDPTFNDALTAFYTEMSVALREQGRQLWLTVPMGEDLVSFQLDRLASVVDRFVAVFHGENSGADPAGPTASKEWFEGWLETSLGYGEPSQWIATLGTGGYDWSESRGAGESITFSEAMSRADYAGLDEIKRDGFRAEAPTFEPHFCFHDQRGIKHRVWFQDAITFLNQMQVVRRRGFGGIGIDRIGGEDPGVWSALKMAAPPTPAELESLARIPSGESVAGIGRGAIVGINVEREDGSRNLEVMPDGHVMGTYTNFGSFATLFRQGGDGDSHAVSLTFDDGPDPTWTPMILDVLKRENVKATFFIVGSRAELYPGIVRRIVEEGHELGNHTYTHANVAASSEQQLRLELNATQRLIETITGRSTLLFRPPYNADAGPTRFDDLGPLNVAQSMGYMIALEDIDSLDWTRQGVDQILARVRHGRQAGGNVVLLHDAGGNRAETLEALPKLIDYFQRRGDQLVPLHGLLGKTYADVMPRVAPEKLSLAQRVAGVGFRVIHAIESVVWALLLAATGLVLVRTLLVLWLAARFPWRKEDTTGFSPAVSVVIPAFNEGKVIAATVRSVLATTYEGAVEVIVVDDGSIDGTSAIVHEIAATDGRVRLVGQANVGKSMALDHGLREARHEFAVLLDADTKFRPDTIGQLVQPLRDAKVAAVSGHAKVGNPRSLIAKCQALEYICGFNLDRRAYATWNCITVAPGAVSAVRMSALRAVGGMPHDTLAEDTDLTLALHRAGYRIAYTPAALAYTEAPETFSGLAKQRFRWAFGTMQCLWKHRDLTCNPRFGALGLFSLPSIWFFQIALVAVMPFIDFALILSLFLGNGAAILPYFAVFLGIDVVLAVAACALEREPLWRAWIMIPMRLIYRVLLSYVIWKAIGRALSGALVGWGKLERTAGVELAFPALDEVVAGS